MDKGREDEKQMTAVNRTVVILETLSLRDSINLESLSKETGLPKATLLRFLSTLISNGYVYRDDSDSYHLTLKMFSVGSRSLKHMDLISTAKPFTLALSHDFKEAVHMGIMQDDNAIYVIKEESSYNLRMYSRVGKIIPLYCTSIGKIFLSAMSEEQLSAYFASHPLTPFTEKSIKTENELRTELETIRQRGWAVDNEEHEPNIVCIGAPVKDHTGAIIAAISVSWPLFRFDRSNMEAFGQKIKAKTEELSRVLGYLD